MGILIVFLWVKLLLRVSINEYLLFYNFAVLQFLVKNYLKFHVIFTFLILLCEQNSNNNRIHFYYFLKTDKNELQYI